MGRRKLSTRRLMAIHVVESVYNELVLLKPELMNSEGHTKYGAISSYFNQLLRKDLEEIKEKIKKSLEKTKEEKRDENTSIS